MSNRYSDEDLAGLLLDENGLPPTDNALDILRTVMDAFGSVDEQHQGRPATPSTTDYAKGVVGALTRRLAAAGTAVLVQTNPTGAKALADAIERLTALGVPADARVYVDDENRCPSYARHWWVVSDERDSRGYKTNVVDLDDEELDDAVAWLPSESFLKDIDDGPYLPYTTLEHLRTLEVS